MSAIISLMQTPSKKVLGIMIIILATTSAFIVSDKLKNTEKETQEEVFGEIKPDNSVSSIEEYMLDKINESNEELANSDLAPKTVTEFAVIELLSGYQNLKEQSLDTPENLDALTTNLALQTKQFSTIPTKYEILDLKTFPDYEQDKVKEYGNTFAQITEKYYKQKFFIEEEDSMEYVKAYAQIQLNYSDELSKIEVPRSISDEHLEFTNNLSKIGVAIVSLSENENDTLLSALILSQYNKIRIDQPNLLIKISDYFINNGIIFYDNEPGAMWNNI
jgi:hypothetical protein